MKLLCILTLGNLTDSGLTQEWLENGVPWPWQVMIEHELLHGTYASISTEICARKPYFLLSLHHFGEANPREKIIYMVYMYKIPMYLLYFTVWSVCFMDHPGQYQFDLIVRGRPIRRSISVRCCMDGHGSFGQLVATMAVQTLPCHAQKLLIDYILIKWVITVVVVVAGVVAVAVVVVAAVVVVVAVAAAAAVVVVAAVVAVVVVVVVVVAAAVVAVAVVAVLVLVLVLVLAFWCWGGGGGGGGDGGWAFLQSQCGTTLWQRAWQRTFDLTCVHQGCLWCGKSSEVLGFPMQLEGAFAGRSAGDRVCMRLQCLLFLLLFLIILHRFSIQFLRFTFVDSMASCTCHFLWFFSNVFPRFVQEEDIPDILVEAYQSIHSHITVSSSGWSNFRQRFWSTYYWKNMEALHWFMASGQCLSMKFNEPLWMLSVQTADRKLTSTPGLFWELQAIADADGWSVDTSGCTAVMVLWKDQKARIPRNRATMSQEDSQWYSWCTLAAAFNAMIPVLFYATCTLQAAPCWKKLSATVLVVPAGLRLSRRGF